MLRVFRDRAPMGRTSMARHRCMGLPSVATRRLSNFFWMKAQMLYCLLTLESCSFQVRKRCSLGGKHHRVGGAFANCVSSGCRWPGTQSKMFVFFGSSRSPGINKHCRQEMLLSSETCWAHDLGGIEGFGGLEAPVSNTGRWSAEIGQVIVMYRHVCTERTSKHKCQQEVQIGCRVF